MSRNKGQRKKKTDDQINSELEAAIGEKFAVLKGGKLGPVVRSSTKNRNEFEAEYTVNDKVYIVSGRFNPKRGDVSIDKISEPVGQAEL